MREDYEKAELYLRDSLKVYEEFTLREKDENGRRSSAAFSLKNLLEQRESSSFSSSSFEESDKSLELLNAYTYYFLAQVYQKTR